MKILEIQLQTHRPDELKRFYREKLGLSIIREHKRSFTIQAGASKIRFENADADDEPFYHFAFNIPENQLADAKHWLSSRVKLFTQDGQDEFRFASWNADSVYFYDPAGNIVEFIARHNLNNATDVPFSGKSILCVSEIGHPVDNVRLFSEHIRRELQLKLWYGDERKFAAVGDEEGLFIIVEKERPWYPVNKPAEDYPLSVDVG